MHPFTFFCSLASDYLYSSAYVILNYSCAFYTHSHHKELIISHVDDSFSILNLLPHLQHLFLLSALRDLVTPLFLKSTL